MMTTLCAPISATFLDNKMLLYQNHKTDFLNKPNDAYVWLS